MAATSATADETHVVTIAPPQPIEALCMACDDAKCEFKPKMFKRRPMNEHDVVIDMKYCGVCHTDVHVAADHLGFIGGTAYPCVPGALSFWSSAHTS